MAGWIDSAWADKKRPPCRVVMARARRALRPNVERVEGRTLLTAAGALKDIVYGHTVQVDLTPISANTLAPIPGAVVTVFSTSNIVYSGASGVTASNGEFTSEFNNPKDYTALKNSPIYVIPDDYHEEWGYEDGFGYDPTTGEYEEGYFYGEFDVYGPDPANAYWEDNWVPVNIYETSYTVTVSAPGYQPLTTSVSLGANGLDSTLAVSLASPPAYSDQYAQQLYQQIYARQPSPNELVSGGTALESMTAQQYALSLLKSEAAAMQIVQGYSESLTGGTLAPNRVTKLAKEVASSGSEIQAIEQIVESPAFNRTHRAVGRKVTAIYETLTGVAPTEHQLKSGEATIAQTGAASLVHSLFKRAAVVDEVIQAWAKDYGVPSDTSTVTALSQSLIKGKGTLQIRSQLLDQDVN
jgi:hypothetical protein